MVGHPACRLSVRCAVSRSGRAICENLQRGSPTAIIGATSVTAKLPPPRSKSMRGRHDNHRRFEVPAANGSRPIVGGRLRGDKVSELFRTCRNRWRTLSGKWLELLKDIAPGVTRVAVLQDPIQAGGSSAFAVI